jgi:hypothetical protein
MPSQVVHRKDCQRPESSRSFYSPDFGERLGKLIIDAGYRSLNAFALEHRFHPVMLHKWVKKGTSPTIENVFRLSIALDVTPAVLTWGEDWGQRFVDDYNRVR